MSRYVREGWVEEESKKKERIAKVIFLNFIIHNSRRKQLFFTKFQVKCQKYENLTKKSPFMLLPNFRKKIFIMAFFRNLLFKQEINHPIIIVVRKNSLINGKYEHSHCTG